MDSLYPVRRRVQGWVDVGIVLILVAMAIDWLVAFYGLGSNG